MSIPRNLGNFADNVNTNGKVEVTGINATGTPSSTTVLYGDGTWNAISASGINVQTFTSSGTWTKPSLGSGSRVLIQAWGGGGSGGKSSYGAGGGGGGGYKERWVTLSAMGATETITIGAGGASLSSNGYGNVGGTTTVGSLVTAYGGGGGTQGKEGSGINVTPGGGGAGMFGPGVNATSGDYWGAGGYPDGGGGPPRYDGGQFNTYLRQIAGATGLYSYTMGNDAFSDTAGAGGGGRIEFTDDGGNTARPTFNGGRAVWGGGGGGGTQGTTGGVSQFGGNGGNGGATGTAGTQPAGGGGGSSSGNSGAGAAGQVIITVFPS